MRTKIKHQKTPYRSMLEHTQTTRRTVFPIKTVDDLVVFLRRAIPEEAKQRTYQEYMGAFANSTQIPPVLRDFHAFKEFVYFLRGAHLKETPENEVVFTVDSLDCAHSYKTRQPYVRV